MMMQRAVQQLDAAPVLQQVQHAERHGAYPGETIGAVEQACSFRTTQADGASQHEAGRESVGPAAARIARQ